MLENLDRKKKLQKLKNLKTLKICFKNFSDKFENFQMSD